MLRPMLAVTAPEDLHKLKFPLYASFKIDAIRATVQDGCLVSRSLKPLPNHHIQSFPWAMCEGFDGELVVGSPNVENTYSTSMSAIMTHSGEPDWTYYLFDHIGEPRTNFETRKARLETLKIDKSIAHKFVVIEQKLIKDVEQLLRYETRALECGYEGLILKSRWDNYKHGRSTITGGECIKLKRFMDAEAMIVGMKPRFHNANIATINELGGTSRSSHKANQIELEELGSFIVRDCKTGVQFGVGTGFTAKERVDYWAMAETIVTTRPIITYKYFPVGVKDKPRHPVFKGFRDPIDM